MKRNCRDRGGVDETPSVSVNADRAKTLFMEAAAQVEDDARNLGSRLVFTYLLKMESDDENVAGAPTVRLIAPEIRNRLASKANLARLLKQEKIEGIFPATYMSAKEARAHTPAVSLWFMKVSHGTAGKDMKCLAHAELESLSLPKWHVLQAAVENIRLMDGHKFTTRVYVFVWNGRIYLYREGFCVRHGVPYVRGSTDYDVQINHAGYDDDEGPVTMLPLSRIPGYVTAMNAFEQALTCILPVLEECRLASSDANYVLLGIDGLLQEHGGVKLIEINAIPNFIHTDAINTEVNIPFFKACMLTMLGKDDPDLIRLLPK